MTKAIVYIEESNSMADVTFPSLPHVVSLLHYDNVARTADMLHPPAGYPVICVTVSQAEIPINSMTVMIYRQFLRFSGDSSAKSPPPSPPLPKTVINKTWFSRASVLLIHRRITSTLENRLSETLKWILVMC